MLSHAAFIPVSTICKRIITAALLLAFALLTACAGGPAAKSARSGVAEPFPLTILHTNDMHAGYGGSTSQGRLCYAAMCEGGEGGSLRLLAAATAIKRDRPNVIFLDAGDEFQGSLYFNVHKEVMAAAMMNAMGYDAVIPGNHEFDDGPEPFLHLVEILNMPMLAANVHLSGLPVKEHGLPANYQPAPWAILTREGRHIGVVGLLTVDTARDASPGPGVQFSDEAAALRQAVAELSARGVNIIVALTHVGLHNDRALARAVPGVDVFVGGHSHSLLSNTAAGAEGPYPIVETSPSGEPVLVVTASFGGRLLGDLNVTFDAQGVAQSWSGEPIPLNDAGLEALHAPKPYSALAARINAYSADVTALLAQPIARLNVPGFDGKPLEEPNVRICRAMECLTGNITADAMLAMPGLKADAALVNGGSLRNSLPGGMVTMGDILATLPFNNYVVVTQMSGQTLLAALDHGVSEYGQDKGRFLQVAGLTYTFDPARPAGQRILSAQAADNHGVLRPINPEGQYRIATLDYMAGGGDGFTMFADLDWQNPGFILSDIVRDYLDSQQGRPPLAPRLEGRITKE